MAIKYGGRGRDTNPAFIEYMERIVHHPNYAGIPGGIVEDGKIRWNAPSHRPPGTRWSNLHEERETWWKAKAKSLGIPIGTNWISITAKTIHPFQEKPCQTCGRTMSLKYEYPTRLTLSHINKIQGIAKPFVYTDFAKIGDIIKSACSQAGQQGLNQIATILGYSNSSHVTLDELLSYVDATLIPSEPRGILSPGAMSDAPDRLDGFHTYNLCCRPGQDTGRSKENLKTYGLDRRAFEYWVEGDWAAADYVMKQTVHGTCEVKGCKNVTLTADHVGPLSLGFCHRPKFRALCRAHNSARRNRLFYDDVKLLLHDEELGEKVVSWQGKYIWDAFKHKIGSDADASRLTEMMLVNQHHYLTLLAKLKQNGCTEYLETLLHPEFALNKYRLKGDKGEGYSFGVVPVPRHETYANKKIERVKRIAFQALDDYVAKSNRRIPPLVHPTLLELESEVIAEALRGKSTGDYSKVRWRIERYLEALDNLLIERGVPRAYSLDKWSELS